MSMDTYALERKIEQLHGVIGELNLILSHEFKGREITEEIKDVSGSIASLDHGLMSQLSHINFNMEKKLDTISKESKSDDILKELRLQNNYLLQLNKYMHDFIKKYAERHSEKK